MLVLICPSGGPKKTPKPFIVLFRASVSRLAHDSGRSVADGPRFRAVRLRALGFGMTWFGGGLK